MDGLYLRDLIKAADIGREQFEEFHRLRIEAFAVAQKVYADRAIGYNVDHPAFQEQVYGPVSLASEIYKRARRMAALLSPLREEPLRESDLNRILDICVDTINYLSWNYALVILATKAVGHPNSDDAPLYLREEDVP